MSNSSLVSGPSEASRARLSWVEVSQKVGKNPTDNDYWVSCNNKDYKLDNKNHENYNEQEPVHTLVIL